MPLQVRHSTKEYNKNSIHYIWTQMMHGLERTSGALIRQGNILLGMALG